MNLKTIAVASVFLLVGFLTFSQHSGLLSGYSATQPCEQPLTYRIGDIDSRFNITKAQLKEIMIQVEDLWTTALDKDLLDYDENGRVVIHLVYSKDQKRMEEERAFSKRIEIKKDQIETSKQEYYRYRQRFDQQTKEFQSTVDKYNREIESYNEYAGKWNKNSMPAHAVNHLQRKERTISRLKSEITRKQQDLESLRQQTNAKSEQLNKLVEEQNEIVSEYNARFSDAKKFDQGRYIREGDSERINIFQFANHAQLKTVLAHEAGHAFGLGHVDNPKSVMHEMMGKQNIFDLQLTEEDILAIKNQCTD